MKGQNKIKKSKMTGYKLEEINESKNEEDGMKENSRHLKEKRTKRGQILEKRRKITLSGGS